MNNELNPHVQTGDDALRMCNQSSQFVFQDWMNQLYHMKSELTPNTVHETVSGWLRKAAHIAGHVP